MKLSNLLLALAICTSFCSIAIAQSPAETKYKIGKHLLILFPRVPDSMVMEKNILKTVETDGLTYIVSVNINDTAFIKNKNDFDEAMKDVTEGYLSGEQIKIFKNRVTDTAIGGASGKYLHLFSGGETMGSVEMFAFLTIQDQQLYTIQVVAPDGLPATRDSVAAFFATSEFLGKNYPEKTQAYKVGYALGRYIVPGVLVVALLIFFIARIVKRSKRKGNLTGSV